ncbi:MAG: single-stranded DNA-binding protein [Chloroflexota bacterium]
MRKETPNVSRSLSRAMVIGRLGRDPDMRYLPDGRARTRFSVATDRPVRAGAQAEADWHNIVCWERQAEFAYEYLRKGRLVYVAGRLTYRTYQGRDGQPRHATEIVADEIIPLDRRPETAPEAAEIDESAGPDAGDAGAGGAPSDGASN